MSLLDALLLDPAAFHVWIAIRPDGIRGCGTMNDPYDGSTQARFDAVMQEIVSRFEDQAVAVHLGPGEFETRGYPTSGGWQIQPRMRLCGSGIDVTTLKLVDAGAGHAFAVSHDLAARADFAEVSDLTIDCNLEVPAGYTVHGAVRLKGHGVRVHRVKAIHWGGGAEVSGGGCTVFSLVTTDEAAATGQSPEPAELSNSGFDECQAVDRASNRDTTVTAFQIGPAAGASFNREFHGRAPYIRNCYIDAGVAEPDPATPWVTAIAAAWCRGGVIEGNHIYNVDVGVTQPGLSSRDLIVRNNFLKNVGLGVLIEAAMAGSLGAGDLSLAAPVATIEDVPTTTLQPGDRVRLVTSPDAFSGVHVVASILSGTSFTVRTPVTSPSSAAVTAVYPLRSPARVMIENNQVELTPSGDASAVVLDDGNDTSPYPEPPDHVFGDAIVRGNQVRYVDGVTPDDDGASLIDVSGSKHLIVQSNVLETIAALPLQNRRCGHATYFNNRTPGGVLLRGWDDDLDRKYDELETEAEDAFVLALFRRH